MHCVNLRRAQDPLHAPCAALGCQQVYNLKSRAATSQITKGQKRMLMRAPDMRGMSRTGGCAACMQKHVPHHGMAKHKQHSQRWLPAQARFTKHPDAI